MLEDSKGTKALAQNPLSSSNSTHIYVRDEVLRDLVAKKILTKHRPSKEQRRNLDKSTP